MRKQRWAAVIAAILALAMTGSAIAAYSGHLLNRRKSGPEPAREVDLDAYRDYYSGEIERLEKYIEDVGPTAPVLGQLVELYDALIRIEEEAGGASEETLQGYRDQLLQFNCELIAMEPDRTRHRLQLLNYYEKFGEDAELIAGEIGALRDLLHEHPEPASSLMLIGFMKSTEQPEQIVDDEIDFLKGYLEQMESSGKIDSQDRYCYALLLGEYLEDPEGAEEQLALILDEEPEESDTYTFAKNYLERLQKEKETDSEQ